MIRTGELGRRMALAAMGLAASAVSGCSFPEVLADGLYGGVSDTIAGAISNVALRLLGLQ